MGLKSYMSAKSIFKYFKWLTMAWDISFSYFISSFISLKFFRKLWVSSSGSSMMAIDIPPIVVIVQLIPCLPS